jgi:hypothetical protein
MWVKLDSNDQVTAEYPRAVPLLIDDVQYPAGIFKNPGKLRTFGIVPLRRVQLNAPDDTTGWTSTYVDTYDAATRSALREVTWAKRADFDQKVAERDAKLARQAWDAKRVALEDFLYLKGYTSESQLTAADLIDFEASSS